MSDFLDAMAAASLARAREVESTAGVTGLRHRVPSARPPVPLSVSESGFDLIAEAKLASPSEGTLIAASDATSTVRSIAEDLAESGPAVLSILTEPEVFKGTMQHLEVVAADSDIPVMRKDFLVDPIQIHEARAAGASGVLLIARILSRSQLVEMTDLTMTLGMFALVELFDRSDIGIAEAVFDRPVLVGVNSRDLRTLAVDPNRHTDMVPLLPENRQLVAESGITSPEDAAAVASAGYQMALVGSSLVKSSDPGHAASAMIRAGRAAAGSGIPS